MLSINVSTQAALDAGRIIERGLILFDFSEGLYGFWDGAGPLVYNGVTYTGAGGLIEVETIDQGSGLDAIGVTVRLTSVPNSDLSPDVLATIENYTYHQRPCSIMAAFINPDNYTIMSVETIYNGYIDQVVHDTNIEGNAYIEGRLESRFRDHQRKGYRVRSDLDQKRIDGSDTGLRHVTTVATETILFGKVADTAANAAAAAPVKKKSFFERIFG